MVLREHLRAPPTANLTAAIVNCYVPRDYSGGSVLLGVWWQPHWTPRRNCLDYRASGPGSDAAYVDCPRPVVEMLASSLR
jgi:hypothetical protein